MKYKKSFETMNAIGNGNTVDFWEWYYRGKFRENVAFYSAGKKDYLTELKKHYDDMITRKQISIEDLSHWNRTYRESAEAFLNQLKAMENIFNELESDCKTT